MTVSKKKPQHPDDTPVNRQSPELRTRKRTAQDSITDDTDEETIDKMTSSGRLPLPHGGGETDVGKEASGVGQPRDRQKTKRQKGTTHTRKREEEDRNKQS